MGLDLSGASYETTTMISNQQQNMIGGIVPGGARNPRTTPLIPMYYREKQKW